ncbi:hypothetical protein Q3G72_034272 [Acer saccharum]|nr:hypothetical protein Q3G72_034272 [Acer saccharum]
MRGLVRERLPKFTKKQTRMVKGSYDFIGINYYTAIYAVDVSITNSSNISCSTVSLAILTPEREGIPIGPQPSVKGSLLVLGFGIYFIDYEDGLKRYPKHSALWFKNFL